MCKEGFWLPLLTNASDSFKGNLPSPLEGSWSGLIAAAAAAVKDPEDPYRDHISPRIVCRFLPRVHRH